MDGKNYVTEQQKMFGEWRMRENHQEKQFIEDGIVNPEVWFSSLSQGQPKILFVLKEAYGEAYSLSDALRKDGPWGSIWKRVAEWTYGILHTTDQRIARYKKLDWAAANELLSYIAVINLKKSNGTSHSVDDNLKLYAEKDACMLRQQFGLISPDIVICGSTFSLLNEALTLGFDKRNHPSDNWYYWNAAGQLYLDFYHPANQYPALLNYYGIASIYQQALIEKAVV